MTLSPPSRLDVSSSANGAFLDDENGAMIAPSPIRKPKPDMDDASPPPLNPRKQTSSVPFDEESLTTSPMITSGNSNSHDDDNVIDTPLVDRAASSNTDNEENDSSAAQLQEEDEDPEAESIALARMLMEQEAIESYGALSADYLRYNSHLFSQEDLAALQAAMAEDGDEDEDAAGGANEQPFSYDVMLRLGESIGDVKKERWNLSSQSHIDKLPTFAFDPKTVVGKDENDCDVKCLVCQFAYEKDDKLLRLPCGHAFHSECVVQWLKDNDVCPYCRQTIVAN